MASHRSVVMRAADVFFAGCLDCSWRGKRVPVASGLALVSGLTLVNEEADHHAANGYTPPPRRIRTIPVPRKWRR